MRSFMRIINSKGEIDIQMAVILLAKKNNAVS
jgi:hypothetical protein